MPLLDAAGNTQQVVTAFDEVLPRFMECCWVTNAMAVEVIREIALQRSGLASHCFKRCNPAAGVWVL
jgi:hypothetical protein